MCIYIYIESGKVSFFWGVSILPGWLQYICICVYIYIHIFIHICIANGYDMIKVLILGFLHIYIQIWGFSRYFSSNPGIFHICSLWIVQNPHLTSVFGCQALQVWIPRLETLKLHGWLSWGSPTSRWNMWVMWASDQIRSDQISLADVYWCNFWSTLTNRVYYNSFNTLNIHQI